VLQPAAVPAPVPAPVHVAPPTVMVPASVAPEPAPSAAPPANRTLEEVEIDMIRAALDAAGGNISEASKRLGISRNTIYRKLRWNKAA
jgi:transcriptional regulator of acetoin/glycerol metabolism